MALVFFLLILSVLVGYVDVWNYFKHKNLLFLDGVPSVQNPDGFLFIRYAYELAQGRYPEMDHLRYFPEVVANPPMPALISVFYALLYRATGIRIEYLDLFLHPVLASLFIIPLYILLRRITESHLIAFGGSLVGALSSVYIDRTVALALDTEALNLFFPTLIALFLYNYYKDGKALNLVLSFIAGWLFFLWYYHPELILSVYLPFLLLLALKRDWRAFRLLYSLAFLLLSLELYSPGSVLGFLWRFLVYTQVKTVAYEGLPDVFKTIGEQTKVGFFKSWGFFFTNGFVFYLSLLGFVLALLRFPLLAVCLFTFIALSFLAYYTGKIRLYIFLAPLLGVGLGFILHLIFSYFKRLMQESPLLRFVSISPYLMLLLFIPFYNVPFRGLPINLDVNAQRDFKRLSELLPLSAVILSWWDWGYALQYLAKRPTFHDGGTQTKLKNP